MKVTKIVNRWELLQTKGRFADLGVPWRRGLLWDTERARSVSMYVGGWLRRAGWLEGLDLASVVSVAGSGEVVQSTPSESGESAVFSAGLLGGASYSWPFVSQTVASTFLHRGERRR
jgi:hypothetical protein